MRVRCSFRPFFRKTTSEKLARCCERTLTAFSSAEVAMRVVLPARLCRLSKSNNHAATSGKESSCATPGNKGCLVLVFVAAFR